jgi:hypothetical protein
MLRTDLLEADGFSAAEIQQIAAALHNKRVDQRAALIVLKGNPRLVCWSIAELLDMLRPGCWVRAYRDVEVVATDAQAQNDASGFLQDGLDDDEPIVF